jgi:hypothetical protein
MTLKQLEHRVTQLTAKRDRLKADLADTTTRLAAAKTALAEGRKAAKASKG